MRARLRATLRVSVATVIVTACLAQSACGVWSFHDELGPFRGQGLVVEHGSLPDFDIEGYGEESRLRDRGVDVDSGGGLIPVLAAIRARWPEFREVTARMDHQPGMLLLGLEPPLDYLVRRSLPEEGTSGRFLTGYGDFDQINRDIGVRRVKSYRPLTGMYAFSFNSDVNASRAAERYQSLRWVKYVETNGPVGDSSDLHAF